MVSECDDPRTVPWAGRPPHVAAARDRILEAACRRIESAGLAATSMAAVAEEAGVSRQTVYRYFAGRKELVRQVIFSRARTLGEKLHTLLAPLEEPADIVVEALVLGISEIRDDPVLNAMWGSTSSDGLAAELFTEPGGIEWTRELLADAVERAPWEREQINPAIEFFLRVGLSMLMSSKPERDEEELRAFLYRFLVPGLGLATAEDMRNDLSEP